jgi:hypothetical protein
VRKGAEDATGALGPHLAIDQFVNLGVEHLFQLVVAFHARVAFMAVVQFPRALCAGVRYLKWIASFVFVCVPVHAFANVVCALVAASVGFVIGHHGIMKPLFIIVSAWFYTHRLRNFTEHHQPRSVYITSGRFQGSATRCQSKPEASHFGTLF